MIRAVVTGGDGFIGKNLRVALSRNPGFTVISIGRHNTDAQLSAALYEADVVFHLAGVNRPQNQEDFQTGNADLTRRITETLMAAGRKPLIVFSSSKQASMDNPYGQSKRLAEDALKVYAQKTGAAVRNFRLTNVFGKWCKPNYNSAVATFCHNIARGLPVTVSDPARELELFYVDDVVAAFLAEAEREASEPGYSDLEVNPTFRVTLGELVKQITELREIRTSLRLPGFEDGLCRRLHATFISCLPENDFAYALEQKPDARGSLAELLKSPAMGQIFVSRTFPGITRGNHYHDTKIEKFCVLEGEAIIRFRHVLGEEVLAYPVSGHEFRVVDIPPGYVHSIENVGSGEMVVLFWANEPFDASVPDTYFQEVLREQT